MVVNAEDLDEEIIRYKTYFSLETVLNDWDGRELLYKSNKLFMNDFFREGNSQYFPDYHSSFFASKDDPLASRTTAASEISSSSTHLKVFSLRS
jgi:hypothetical protein